MSDKRWGITRYGKQNDQLYLTLGREGKVHDGWSAGVLADYLSGEDEGRVTVAEVQRLLEILEFELSDEFEVVGEDEAGFDVNFEDDDDVSEAIQDYDEMWETQVSINDSALATVERLVADVSNLTRCINDLKYVVENLTMRLDNMETGLEDRPGQRRKDRR